jgi:hypothetical protein
VGALLLQVRAGASASDAASAPAGVAAAVTVRTQSGEAVPADRLSAAQAYWSRLRAAVLADDMPALRALTARPLLVKGEVDEAKPRRVTDSAMEPTLRQLLQQSVFQGAGKPAPTLAQLIRDTEVLPERAWVSPRQIRVHNLDLRWIGGQWKLATVYSDEP